MKPPLIRDNLKSASGYWENVLKAQPDVLSIVNHGYSLSFMAEPPMYKRKNNKSANDNSDFVNLAINELLRHKLVKEVDSKTHIVSPLSVSSNNGKNRLILDLSSLNEYIKAEKFTLEDQNDFFEYCEGDKWGASFDIKSCYHQISINEKSWTYLGFNWFLDGVKKYFVFCVLPFGLST